LRSAGLRILAGVPYTRPEAIRGMIETMLHILSKYPGEKPAKKAKK
jgi:hypothetical protein